MNLLLILVRPLLPRKLSLLVREGTMVSTLLAQDVRHPALWRWLYRHFYKNADRIICQTDYMLTDLAEHFGVPREKMMRIYNPVDVDRIRRLAEADGNPHEGPGPHLVAVGRLSREKGYDLLLEAMVLVRKTIREVQLTILGDGPLKEDLRAQIDRLGLSEAVHLVEFRSNPYPYMRHAALVVSSSRFDGLPNALLEALALETPAVATDCPGGMKELVNHADGLRLVPMDSPVLLAECLVKTLDEMKHRRCQQGNSRFVETFSVGKIVAKYEALLERASDVSPF